MECPPHGPYRRGLGLPLLEVLLHQNTKKMIMMMVPAMKIRRRRKKRNTKASPRATNAKSIHHFCVKRFTNYRLAREYKARISPGLVLREVKNAPGELKRALAIDQDMEGLEPT